MSYNHKIKVTSPSFSQNSYLRNELLKYFPNTEFNDKGVKYDNLELEKFLKDADGAIISLEPITLDLLRKCPSLRIISKYGVGLDNVDIDACKKQGIKVGWTGGVNRLSVSEQALAFMLLLSRNLSFTSLQLRSGKWNKVGGTELTGKTIGIIGVGHIGKELVRLLKPFNCKIMVNDIIDQEEFYKKNELIEASKEEIFKKADIITLHTPLTSETKHLINRESLSLMKKEAFIINTARGAIVNQEDLKEVLKNGQIAGAALDVYEDEPIKDMELVCLPNIFCTPHIAGNSAQAVKAMGLSAISHLNDFFNNSSGSV